MPLLLAQSAVLLFIPPSQEPQSLTLCAGCHRSFTVDVTDSSTSSHVRQGQYPSLESQAGAPLQAGSHWRRLCGCTSDKERCGRGCASSQAALSAWVRVYREICGFGVNLTDTPGSFSAT